MQISKFMEVLVSLFIDFDIVKLDVGKQNCHGCFEELEFFFKVPRKR